MSFSMLVVYHPLIVKEHPLILFSPFQCSLFFALFWLDAELWVLCISWMITTNQLSVCGMIGECILSSQRLDFHIAAGLLFRFCVFAMNQGKCSCLACSTSLGSGLFDMMN